MYVRYRLTSPGGFLKTFIPTIFVTVIAEIISYFLVIVNGFFKFFYQIDKILER